MHLTCVGSGKLQPGSGWGSVPGSKRKRGRAPTSFYALTFLPHRPTSSHWLGSRHMTSYTITLGFKQWHKLTVWKWHIPKCRLLLQSKVCSTKITEEKVRTSTFSASSVLFCSRPNCHNCWGVMFPSVRSGWWFQPLVKVQRSQWRRGRNT